MRKKKRKKIWCDKLYTLCIVHPTLHISVECISTIFFYRELKQMRDKRRKAKSRLSLRYSSYVANMYFVGFDWCPLYKPDCLFFPFIICLSLVDNNAINREDHEVHHDFKLPSSFFLFFSFLFFSCTCRF